MNVLRGHYTSRRESGVDYTYEGAWFALAHSVVWNAHVFRGGELASTLTGRFHRPEGPVDPDTVIRVVEASIELQSGVSRQ